MKAMVLNGVSGFAENPEPLVPAEIPTPIPGKGELLLTGQLGDVMKESAQTGISYIRSISPNYKIANDYFKKHDFHIHIPQGSVP